MPEPTPADPSQHTSHDRSTHDGPVVEEEMTTPSLALRGAFGGAMMGLANLVPGISGGTMLLAAGIYPRFINAVAELTTLKVRFRSVLLLGCVVAAGGLTIVLLAAPTKDLVLNHRWVMYSLFIGLTLGGLPLVYRLVKPMTPSAWIGAVLAFLVMLAMAFFSPAGGGSANLLLLTLAGVAGASAMILPGVSGAYLLLLLGQYVPILAAISNAKAGLLGDDGQPRDMALFLDALWTLVPVGVGVVVGVAGVSNLLRWLLARFPKPTLGVLLGLLVGAVAGLWPFAEYVRPEPGYRFKGAELTAAEIDELPRQDWPVAFRAPSPAEAGASVALIAAGFGLTMLVDRLGRRKPARD